MFFLNILVKVALIKYREIFYSKRAFAKYQQKKFSKILHFAYENSKFYQEFYNDHGLKKEQIYDPEINSNDLPIITKKILMDNIDNIYTDNNLKIHEIESWLRRSKNSLSKYKGKYYILHTSGSTNKVTIMAYKEKEMYSALAEIISNVSRPRFKFRKTKAVFMGFDKGHYTGITLTSLCKSLYNLKYFSLAKDSIRTIHELSKFAPEQIGAYPSVLYDLVALKKDGLLTIDPELIVSSGETLKKELIKEINEYFPNSKLCNTYINTENLYIGRMNKDLTFNISKHYNLVEKSNDDNLIITNFDSFTTPLIRYDTGDKILSFSQNKSFIKAKLNGRSCELIDIVGNNNKLVTIPSSVFEEFYLPSMSRWQVQIRDAKDIVIIYEGSNEINDELKKQASIVLKSNKIDKNIKINIKKVAKIKPDKSGKTALYKIL